MTRIYRTIIAISSRAISRVPVDIGRRDSGQFGYAGKWDISGVIVRLMDSRFIWDARGRPEVVRVPTFS